MIIHDIFTVCDVSMLYDMKRGQMSHVFTDISTGAHVLLDPIQYQICNTVMTQYAQSGLFPSTICMRGHFLHDSMNIYADSLDSLFVVNLKITNMYVTIKDGLLVFRDEKTDLEVEVDGLPEEEYQQFSSELYTLTCKGCDFSKDGYDRVAIVGNIQEIGDKIIYSCDDALAINVTPALISMLFNYTQRSSQ